MSKELIFMVEEAPEGGYLAQALGHSIYTEADTWQGLREAVQDAVLCHFDEAQRPEDFGSIEAAAEFWNTHSLADYWDETEPVEFTVSLQRSTILLPLEQGIAKRLSEAARRQGISAETLANLWLSERLQQIVPRTVGTRVAETREEYGHQEHQDV